MSALYFEKDKYNEDTALKYLKILIKVNNKKIIKISKRKINTKKSANNGKGISVGLLETDDHYEYQVVRLYK